MTVEETHKAAATFRLTSLHDAEKFAEHLSRYGEPISSTYDVRNHLRNIYRYSCVHSEDDRINGKLLSAYIDLELTYLFMMKDSLFAGGTHNRLHDTGKIELVSVLDDFELFSGKMDILYSLSAFSFRIRAFWDKYMGVLFLLYENEKYEKYIRSKSRKKYFLQHAQEWSGISVHLLRCLTNIVRSWLIHSGQTEVAKEIDDGKLCVSFPDPFLKILGDIIEMVDTVRTAEAHGAGLLRKWTLANLSIERSRDFALINHWNHANAFMQALRTTIEEFAAQSSSPQR
ncbi:MAG: hypothetical protein OXQ89_13395 [Rhodospirillaceae bacterium]|nr:hypothetical protein [Rhodospirillaceae bacterium]MDD9998730.1 hypothetical protein [Rhodospirillaceae bacterium]MDE0362064.1 hypothetical protein [Rhodospirillaceae bacterium]